MNELESVKVGDEVAECYSGRVQYVWKVEKVTKFHVIVRGKKYSKKHGRFVCDYYSSEHIKPLTPEVQRQIREQEHDRKRWAIAKKLREVDWRECPLEMLQKVEAALGDRMPKDE